MDRGYLFNLVLNVLVWNFNISISSWSKSNRKETTLPFRSNAVPILSCISKYYANTNVVTSKGDWFYLLIFWTCICSYLDHLYSLDLIFKIVVWSLATFRLLASKYPLKITSASLQNSPPNSSGCGWTQGPWCAVGGGSDRGYGTRIKPRFHHL